MDQSSTLPTPLVSSQDDVMSGTPCFHGTRVPVKNLFDYLAHGEPLDEFLRQFPGITRAHAIAVLAQANAEMANAARSAA
jgi:uncharacterized protein (DUF433 family)